MYSVSNSLVCAFLPSPILPPLLSLPLSSLLSFLSSLSSSLPSYSFYFFLLYFLFACCTSHADSQPHSTLQRNKTGKDASATARFSRGFYRWCAAEPRSIGARGRGRMQGWLRCFPRALEELPLLAGPEGSRLHCSRGVQGDHRFLLYTTRLWFLSMWLLFFFLHSESRNLAAFIISL